MSQNQDELNLGGCGLAYDSLLLNILEVRLSDNFDNHFKISYLSREFPLISLFIT